SLSKTVVVDGNFTVFGYDDTERGPLRTAPDRRFVFAPDQLTSHYSKNSLGHSYSFWVPWDLADGEQRKITLVCRFEPVDGGLIASEPARQILPGRLSATAMAARQHDAVLAAAGAAQAASIVAAQSAPESLALHSASAPGVQPVAFVEPVATAENAA